MRILLVLVFATSVHSLVSQSTIAGVVNNVAAPVDEVDICRNALILPSSTGFSAGDTVLIMQMKGAVGSTADDDGHGSVTNWAGAGLYEINVIGQVFGNELRMAAGMQRDYQPQFGVQVIRIPQFDDVTISGSLTALPWDGATGGVVVLRAAGTITFAADIDVTGRGFRGGTLFGDVSGCFGGIAYTGYTCDQADLCGGRKGEGGLAPAFTGDLGRGRDAQGGGGGNDHNAGGGGGGNHGPGGRGGEYTNAFCQGSGGLGGSANDVASPDRLLMGGGGGAGDENNGVGSAGGDAGGMVILLADRIEGDGFAIRADGLSAATSGGDGAGGGGAGGTVAIQANTVDGLTISVQGGDGGDMDFNDPRCMGPGGGGSGGSFFFSGASIPAGITLLAQGGAAGESVNPGNDCFGSTNGATDGADGGLVPGFAPFTSTEPFVPLTVDAGDDVLICGGDSTTLTGSVQGSRTIDLVWSPGGDSTTTTTVAPVNTSFYTFTGTDRFGCSESDQVFVEVRNPSILLSADPDSAVDQGTEVVLTADVAPAGIDYTFAWSPATELDRTDSSTVVATPSNTRTYCLGVTDELGCEDEACIEVPVLLFEIAAPEAFTPNGDGLNDVFELVVPGVLEVTSLRIYNRWGETVFSSDENRAWTGDGQPAGTYAWSVASRHTITGETRTDQGSLSLLR